MSIKNKLIIIACLDHIIPCLDNSNIHFFTCLQSLVYLIICLTQGEPRKIIG